MTPTTPRLSELLSEAGLAPLEISGPDPTICGITLDSRTVGRGDLFLAFPGEHADGATFAPEAIRRGAGAVLARAPRPEGVDERVAWVRCPDPRRAAGPLSRVYHGRPDESMAIVGITGTNGKTTVVALVQAIAQAVGRRAGRIGTIGAAFAGTEQSSPRTTPEAPELWDLLARMRDEEVEIVAMEVSSHGLALGRVGGLRFAVAAFLNLGRDHFDFHGDAKSYFEAKASLFDSLGSDAWAVLPADDEHGAVLAGRVRGRALTFGRGPSADVRLIEEHCTLCGSSALLETPSGRLPIRTFLPGRFNLDNAAAAAACALALELPPESIPAGILAVTGVPGRMERIETTRPFSVFVDYAHTPAALEQVLGWVRELCRERLLVVFGCGGERDTGKRSEMGRAAARHADRLFVTSDNPRGEDPGAIVEAVAAGAASVAEGGEPSRIVDREQAIAAAIEEARDGDVVLIAGKGHETSQAIGGEVRPFDDREVARRYLRARERNAGA